MYHKIPSDFFDSILDEMYPVRVGILGSKTEKIDWKNQPVYEQVRIALANNLLRKKENNIQDIVNDFFEGLEGVKQKLDLDVKAIKSGDPAAKNVLEIILTYPGFYAIAAYRIAHLLHQLGVDLIPRIITEHAHSKTGIDIHPGANIGESFFIDHGTGVVIGETSIIGNHVSLYQNVTIGGLNPSVTEHGSKRHPTIEDHVVLYAGATILGGNTVVGRNSIIGGNVWLTSSVPENSKVYYKASIENKNEES